MTVPTSVYEMRIKKKSFQISIFWRKNKNIQCQFNNKTFHAGQEYYFRFTLPRYESLL